MNKNSNTYIITYASVMVVIVAAVLSFASAVAEKYSGRERENREKWAISCARSAKAAMRDKAPNKAAYINEQYKKYIVDSYAVNVEGDKVEGRTRSLC